MTPNPQDSAVALEVERAAFEAWALSERWICSINSFGEYTYETVRDGWDAWKARASQSDGTSGGWLEIASAPKDGTAVLVHQKIDNAHWIVTPAYFAGGKWQIVCFHDGNVEYEINPDFWMPLPSAPNQGENHVG